MVLARHGQYGIPDWAPSNSLDTPNMLRLFLFTPQPKNMPWGHIEALPLCVMHMNSWCGLGSQIFLVPEKERWNQDNLVATLLLPLLK